MKKLFLILLLASPCLAKGPKYHFEDNNMNDEFGNVYKDIGNVLNGDVRISSVTISTLTVTNCTGCGTTIVAGQLPATATNDNAAAGKLGEYISSTASFGLVTNNVVHDLTSISLTAGDWLVHVHTHTSSTGNFTAILSGFSMFAGNTLGGMTSVDTYDEQLYGAGATIPTGVEAEIISRFSIATSTTAYAKGRMVFSTGLAAMSAKIEAWRIR